jgi:hypothetical protein
MKSSMTLKSTESMHVYLEVINDKLEIIENYLEGGQQFLREFRLLKLMLFNFERQLLRFEDMYSDWDRRDIVSETQGKLLNVQKRVFYIQRVIYLKSNGCIKESQSKRLISAARLVGCVLVYKRLLKDMVSYFFEEHTSQSVILCLRKGTTDNDSADMHKMRITLSRLLPFWDTCVLLPNLASLKVSFNNKDSFERALTNLAQIIPSK